AVQDQGARQRTHGQLQAVAGYVPAPGQTSGQGGWAASVADGQGETTLRPDYSPAGWSALQGRRVCQPLCSSKGTAQEAGGGVGGVEGTEEVGGYLPRRTSGLSSVPGILPWTFPTVSGREALRC